MTSWSDLERAEPEFAARVQALFDARRHKTIASVRADGSPRISGIEAVFENGELTFGSMPHARKGADLRRDPRFALHSATIDPVDSALSGQLMLTDGPMARTVGDVRLALAVVSGPDSRDPLSVDVPLERAPVARRIARRQH